MAGIRFGPRGRVVVLVVLAALLALAAAGLWLARRSVLVLDAPEPKVVPDFVDTLPAFPRSVVEAPVTYDLDTAIDSLEAAVPRDYGDLDHRFVTANNPRVSFAFQLHRSRFHVRVKGQTVTLSASVEYSGKVWYKPPLAPEIELACGVGNDPPRRATLTLESTAHLTPDWGVRTHSRFVALEAVTDSARDQCRLTFLRIDITPRLFELTRRYVGDKLLAFDAAVARWPARRRFDKIWRDLRKPLRLADSLYMTMNPSAVEVGEIGAHGHTAYANLRLIVAPKVRSGPKPDPGRVPIPRFVRSRNVRRGATVLLDASFTYPVATAILRKALAGRRLREAGRVVRIRDLRLFGIGGGKLALGVQLAGAVRGWAYFTGTPSLDPVSGEIVVPDLDYDVGTANVLVNGLQWLTDIELRDLLRARARLSDSLVVGELSRQADRGMNVDLPARGTHLSGRIQHAEVIEVRALTRDLRVRALAYADLGLSIRRAPSIPRPRPEERLGASRTGR